MDGGHVMYFTQYIKFNCRRSRTVTPIFFSVYRENVKRGIFTSFYSKFGRFNLSGFHLDSYISYPLLWSSSSVFNEKIWNRELCEFSTKSVPKSWTLQIFNEKMPKSWTLRIFNGNIMKSWTLRMFIEKRREIGNFAIFLNQARVN